MAIPPFTTVATEPVTGVNRPISRRNPELTQMTGRKNADGGATTAS